MLYKLGFLLSIIATVISFGLDITDSGDNAKLVAEIIIVLLFVTSVFKNLNHRSKNKGVLLIWMISLCLSPILILIIPNGYEGVAIGDIRESFVPFAITYSSFYLLKLNTKEFRIGLIIIGIVSIFTALYILANTGGFDIVSLYRAEVNKNQTAPFFATVGLISLAFGLSDRKNIYSSFFYIALFIVCLGYCMILRARTATVVILAIAALALYETYKAKLIIILPVLFIIIGSLYADQLAEFFTASIVGHTDASDINDLTSGRTIRMEQSGEFILSHPFFGALSDDGISYNVWNGNFPIVHNYVMWKLVKYGFIFSVPFLIIYFSILKNIYEMFKVSWTKYKYAIICILTAFITSLSEYSAPFGPGTSFILCYAIYGNSLYQFYNKNKVG